MHPQPPKPVEFVDRPSCVVCGSTSLHALWEGRFDGEPARSYLERHQYAGNAVELLAGKSFRLVRCPRCGMIFHARILAPESLERLYSEWIDDAQIDAFETDVARKRGPFARFQAGRQRIKHLLRLRDLAHPEGARALRLLDYGCGDGELLRQATLLGFESYGVDFSTTRSERAGRENLRICGSLRELDALPSAPFDAVLMLEVLEHVVEPITLLREIASRMRASGILIINVPDARSIQGPPRTFQEFRVVHPLEHINAFTPESLRHLCSRAGFVPVQRTPAHVTTRILDVLKTETSRFYRPRITGQYFRLAAKDPR
jgi:2-polyprenyl-3-methyl-5-hydroxy-6-metoxy-1,4-benzoquinol methylase